MQPRFAPYALTTHIQSELFSHLSIVMNINDTITN